MISEDKLKLVLSVVLLVSISIYSVLTEITGFVVARHMSTASTAYSNVLMASKIVSAIISMFMFFVTLKSKMLTKMILRDSYISGKYEGIGYKVHNKDGIVNEHLEYLEIEQDLISTRLSGISKEKEDESGYAHWNGKLVGTENKRYMFLVTTETPYASDIGIMNLNFLGDEIQGFLSASSSRAPVKWKLKFKKINNQQ